MIHPLVMSKLNQDDQAYLKYFMTLNLNINLMIPLLLEGILDKYTFINI